MPQIEVRRLRYRGEASFAGRVEQAVGDALRTETSDDGRLILVRQFALGRIGAGERGAQRAAAKAWRDLVGGARHGGESGAEAANCVWFASPAEARALILRELARGRTPFAWFWALAVPDWRRMTLAQYLDHRLAGALADPWGEALAELVEEALAADTAEALATAILAKIPPGASTLAMPATPPPPESGGAPCAQSDPAQPDAVQPDRDTALAVVRTVPAPLLAAIERLATRAGALQLIEALAHALVRRLHPALALAPRRLASVSALVIELLRSGASRHAAQPATAPPHLRAAPSPREETNPEPAPPHSPRRDEVHARPEPGTGQADAPPHPSAPEPEPAPLAPHEERPSAAAGLFLALVPLIRLGWREWLADNPDWLLHQPGARLLRAIAHHHRVSAEDAIWPLLPPIDLTSEPPAELTEALALWRKGLDGWLRRNAQLNLAELVLRPGWLLPGPDTTIVRFPLERIDIRLRRLALDSDPGWVDWLGHSYRLVYRDRPLTGPQLP